MEALKLREALTCAFQTCSQYQCLNVFLLFPWPKSSELMGVSVVKIERLPGLDEDEKLAELISVATRKATEAFEVVDLARAWGRLFCSMLEDVA